MLPWEECFGHRYFVTKQRGQLVHMLVLDQLYCVSELYYKMAGGKSDSALQLEKYGILFLP